MSNFTEVQIELKDLSVVKKALENMGLTVELHDHPVKIRGYGGRTREAQLVVRDHNQYSDLGIHKDASGKVSVIIDEIYAKKGWMQRLEDEYALETIKTKIKPLGFRVEDVKRSSGGIDVTINNPFS